MGTDCEDICVLFAGTLRVPTVEETVNNQVDKMAHSVFAQPPQSLLCGLVERVALVVGMQAVHVLSNLGFPMVRFILLKLLPNA